LTTASIIVKGIELICSEVHYDFSIGDEGGIQQMEIKHSPKTRMAPKPVMLPPPCKKRTVPVRTPVPTLNLWHFNTDRLVVGVSKSQQWPGNGGDW
jgi:hypothetical protein